MTDKICKLQNMQKEIQIFNILKHMDFFYRYVDTDGGCKWSGVLFYFLL